MIPFLSSKIYAFVLAAIFIIHNIEEYLSFDRMLKLPGKKIFNRKSFLFAIVLLSSLVVLFSVLNYFIDSEVLQKINIVILFALSVNAVQHVIASLRHRRMLPGTYSAAFLILPFAVLYFMKLQKIMMLDFFSIIGYLIVSTAVMIFSIYGSLWLGYRFTRKR